MDSRIREDELKSHINYFCSLGERSLSNYASLEAAKNYIVSEFGGDCLIQEYVIKNTNVQNIELTIEGACDSNDVVIVGAHYDSIYQGANDNASGISAVLALANHFKTLDVCKTVKFVGFTCEEPPYFMTANMGSKRYANYCMGRNNIEVAYIFDLIGWYSNEPGTQTIPSDIDIKRNTGDFIAFISSDKEVHSSTELFKSNGCFPIEGIQVPFDSVYSQCSDHFCFLEKNIPSVLVTDTAMLRTPWYHTEDDTVDKINFREMTRMLNNFNLMLYEKAGVLKEASK